MLKSRQWEAWEPASDTAQMLSLPDVAFNTATMNMLRTLMLEPERWLSRCANAFAKDWCLVLSTHLGYHTTISFQLQGPLIPSSGLGGYLHSHVYIPTQIHTHIHTHNFFNLFYLKKCFFKILMQKADNVQERMNHVTRLMQILRIKRKC